MRIIIVNDDNKIIGYKDRDDRNKTDIIRVSKLWLINSKNEVLIAQRSVNKVYGTGKWSTSAAGTIEKGETYTSNILKEAHEELGIVLKKKDLIIGSPRFVQADHKYFALPHLAKCNLLATDFKLQKDEVEQVQWISIPKLIKWFNNQPQDFVPSFKISLEDLSVLRKIGNSKT